MRRLRHLRCRRRTPSETTGILHFTIGVRDHIAAAKCYSEVLGCRRMRSRSAMHSCSAAAAISCWRRPPPRQSEQSRRRHPPSRLHGGADEFDRALAIMKARGVELRRKFRHRPPHIPRPARLFPRCRRQLHRDHRLREEIGGTIALRGILASPAEPAVALTWLRAPTLQSGAERNDMHDRPDQVHWHEPKAGENAGLRHVRAQADAL